MNRAISSRRTFLADVGLGFTGLALGAMLHRDGIARGEGALAAPKAKRVIWLFFMGGVSHLESFDPKPALNQYAGKTIDESPFKKAVVESPFYRKNVMDFAGTPRALLNKLYPLQIGYKKHGQSGIEVSDWLPHLATCVDDLAVVRSMWTTDNDHAAENQIHTGRHRLDEVQPSVGAWIHYGLGSLNDNLPQYVVLGGPTRPDTRPSVSAYYLGPKYNGVTIEVAKNEPLPHARRSADVLADEQRNEYDLIGQ